MSRRSRQSRRGQKYSASPSDLRHRGRSGPVVVVNMHDVERHAEQMRFWGVPCTECFEVTHAAFSVDQAMRHDAQSQTPVPGLAGMLKTVRRELGPAVIVLLCAECGAVGASVPDGPNAWRSL